MILRHRDCKQKDPVSDVLTSLQPLTQNHQSQSSVETLINLKTTLITLKITLITLKTTLITLKITRIIPLGVSKVALLIL